MDFPGTDLYPDGTPPAAERVYTRSLPTVDGDADAGFPLFFACDALTLGSQALEEIVRGDDTHPAWARAVDAPTAPLWVLPWLASITGVRWNGAPTEALRTQILTRPRAKRGTPDAMRNGAGTNS